MQQAQDQAAFAKARAVTEPEARVTALEQFTAAYPRTALAKRAADLELETLLRAFSERTAAIHALAGAEVARSAPGFERWTEEARLADLLASAGPAGADLPDAKLWATAAVAAMTEESYRRQMRAMETRYKLPPLTGAQRHREFARTRASFLAALANVDLRTKDMEGADRALAEAVRLDPLSSEVSSLRGQLALEQKQDREALELFERAEAEGDLKEPWRGEMVRLYAQQHGEADRADSEGTAGMASGVGRPVPPGLDDEIDALYAKLFPPLYQLSPRTLPAGGHTVLLELFTGAGCAPCAAPDLAVESLLGTYPRQDLVVLEYDEHIPRPDPLTNPDTVARAAAYHVGMTPQAFMDGEEVPVGGASRADVENVVLGFADEVEERAAEVTGVRLAMTVTRSPNGAAQAHVLVSREAWPGMQTAAIHPNPGATLPPSRLVAHFALVEDNVRYSGENGIRFHRMVVRALGKPAVLGPPAKAVGEVAEASFVPGEIEQAQSRYLNEFEKNNDRFGEVRLLTKDIPMQQSHLAIVTWVEDPSSHHVLQAAFQELPR